MPNEYPDSDFLCDFCTAKYAHDPLVAQLGVNNYSLSKGQSMIGLNTLGVVS